MLLSTSANCYSQNINAHCNTDTIKKVLNFDIVIGVYYDDTYNHKFDAKERKWILNDGTLIYKVDAHNVTYSDTISLKETDIQTIINFVKKHNLFISINKDLTKDYLNKNEYTGNINGKLNYNEHKAVFNIKTNSSTSFDEDKDAKKLKMLENLLYQIVETYRNK